MPRGAKQKTLTAAILLLTLTACSHTPRERPIWLDNPAAAAPEGWWTAIGEGPTLAAATDDALLRLAQRIEARVRAVERYADTPRGPILDRRATIRSDARLPGATLLRSQTDRATGARTVLVGLNAAGAASDTAARANAALSANPPRAHASLARDIELAAILDPTAADWPALRAQIAQLVAQNPPPQITAPGPVAAALRDAFGADLTAADWSTTPAASHRPAERLTAWTLSAVVAGEPRRWTGVTRDADPAVAAASRLRAAATMPQ